MRVPAASIGPMLLALPALAVATSCVPQPPPGIAAAQPVETRPAALLRELALDVPDGVTNRSVAPDALAPRVAPAAAPAFLAASASANDAARALECLTQAVYYEARSESADGQRAVAQVVLNRVRDRAFPGSVCGVVYQGSTRRTGCQFSFTCDGSMAGRIEPGAWDRARGIAAAALSGAVYAPIGSATFYHANYVLPWWAASMARIGSVGAHIFYTWRGAMERALSFRQPYAGIEPAAGAWRPAAAIAGGQGEATGGIETVAGVMIHRGGSGAEPGAPAAPSVAAALVPAAVAPVGPRVSIAGGVRVHSGARMPRHIAVPAAGMAVAEVGEESDPT